MSLSGIVVFVTVIVALGAIAYVWRRVFAEGGMSDGTPGSVMDGNEDVRRIDLGTHTFVAQQAHGELTEDGYITKHVTLEEGAFGIGLGSHHYLVYNADDEEHVRAVVDRLLAEL